MASAKANKKFQASSNVAENHCPSPLTLANVINGAPKDIAVVYDTGDSSSSRMLSYEDLYIFSASLSAKLKETGFDGGFVGVYANQMEFFPGILLGVLFAGGAFYCIDPEAPLKEEVKTLKMLDAKYLITTGDCIASQLTGVDAGYFIVHTPALNDSWPNSSFPLYLVHPLPFQSISNSTKPVFDCQEHLPVAADRYAYAIKTSGTTGRTKLVLVPHLSIVVNVLSFVETVFLLKSNDVIFGASPSTFDPNVVEIWMAFLSGGRIVYTTKHIKLNPPELTKLFVRNKISVLQCTPSLMYRFSETEASQFFKDCTNLKIVAFGGEPCPQKSYLERIIPDPRFRKITFYNLYGTTEMSCWASVSKVYMGVLCETGIMDSLEPDTFYKINRNENGEQEILIGTRHRRCTIFNAETGEIINAYSKPDISTGISYLITGDTVNNDDLPLVTYKTRTDGLVKRQGHFVDLYDLELRMMSIPWLKHAACFSLHGRIITVAVLSQNFSAKQVEEYRSKLFPEIQRKIPIKSIPDEVILMSPGKVPLTTNGKLDLNKLKKMVLDETAYDNIGIVTYDEADVAFIIGESWKQILYTLDRPLHNDNFLQCGGDSSRALLFVEQIFQDINMFGTKVQQELAPTLMKMVLRKSFSNVVNYVIFAILPKCIHSVTVHTITSGKGYSCGRNAAVLPNSDCPCGKCSVHRYIGPCVSIKIGNQLRTHHVGYNMLGCVDATPILVDHPYVGPIVIAPSNSGYLCIVKCQEFNFCMPDSNILLFKKFPDRLVAPVGLSQDNLFIFIPCCDYRVYAVWIYPEPHIVWSFFTGGLLRSTPVVNDKNEIVIVVSGNDTVYGLRLHTGDLIWKYKAYRVLCYMPLLIPCRSHHGCTEGLFFASAEGIINLDPSTGKELVSFRLEDICTDFLAHAKSNTFCCGTSTEEIHVLKHGHYIIESIASIRTSGIINTPILYTTPNNVPILVYVTKEGMIGAIDYRTFENLDFHPYQMKVDSVPVIITKGKKCMFAFTMGGHFKFKRPYIVPDARSSPMKTIYPPCPYSHSDNRIFVKEEPILISEERAIVMTSFTTENDVDFKFHFEESIAVPNAELLPGYIDSRLTSVVYFRGDIFCVGGRDDFLHFLQCKNDSKSRDDEVELQLPPPETNFSNKNV